MRGVRAAIVVLVLSASSCIRGPAPTGVTALLAGGLGSFSDCDELLDYLRRHALERVTPWGLHPPWGVARPLTLDADTAVRALADPQAEHSTTNVQVAGIDEPDIVKTDGQRLVALARGRMFVVDVSGEIPSLQASLRLRGFWPDGMFLAGDRVLLLGGSGEPGIHRDFLGAPGVDVAPTAPTVALVDVDLSEPDRPRILGRLLLDGRHVAARMRDGVARVVISSSPVGLRFEHPQGGGLRAEREALRRNREVIRSSTIEQWMPYFVLQDEAGGTVSEGTLLDCPSALHPPEFSGLGVLTLLTLDVAAGLDAGVPERAVGVVSDGETVYASADSVYVGTQRWIDPVALGRGVDEDAVEDPLTRIHRFDISAPDAATYRSSGRVPGWLLNQFAMDEHDGFLRVATTESPPFWASRRSESTVTVLEERDGRLVEVGSVGGLGKGERIFAVRFLGDRGYVVTFREVDPLYVVDLSDPREPAVEGELKILGYSAYLHPVGDGLLLGVGQDATRRGRLKGTQLSLFDVSDPAGPRRIDALRIDDGSSEVEWDHHAFLYWAPEGLAVVPVQVYRWRRASGEAFVGAVAVRLGEGSLDEAARLSHESGKPWGTEIRRSLVVGDLLLTVSDAGVEAADLATLEDAAWVSFR
jgi:hypothetical protein